MPEEDKSLKDLDRELDDMAPRHIIIDPNGYTLHGYDDAEAAGVLSVLAEDLHEKALSAGYGESEDE